MVSEAIASRPMKTFAIPLLFLPLLADAAQYPAVSVPMELRQLSEDVYYVQGEAGVATENEGFVSNAGFVVTGDGVVVFDALGTPALAQELLQLIRATTRQPLRRVYASHYHADHVYGMQVFKQAGARIFAPRGANEYIDSPAATERLEERRFSLEPWVDENTYLVRPDAIVERSMSFELGGKRFTINYQGKAHSDGDLIMLVEPDGVLFSGDLIFEGRVPFIGNGDTAHWLRMLEKLETQGLRALMPGHGPASFEPAATLSLTRRYLSYLRKTLAAGVDELMSFDEIYQSADWSEFEHLPAFEEGNRINAYQVFLSLENELLAE